MADNKNMTTNRTPEGHYNTSDGNATIYKREYGWDLVVGGEWWNTFARKSDALAAYVRSLEVTR